jgi:hypothetical protein
VGLVPGESLPWVLRATNRLVEVVVDSGILVPLDEESVEAGPRARRLLRRQVDVAKTLAVVRGFHLHAPRKAAAPPAQLCWRKDYLVLFSSLTKNQSTRNPTQEAPVRVFCASSRNAILRKPQRIQRQRRAF